MSMDTSEDRFVRIKQCLGAEAFRRLRESFVVVVGLGAVGGYALEGLVRSGVGRLRLVDFDEVRPSNINRQLLALESTLGASKVHLARARALDIHPACHVEALACFAHEETLDTILGGRPDFVLDAIDSLNPKVQLIRGAWARGVPILSSMGAARRLDPTRIQCGDISQTRHCPLARQVRKRLRRLGIAQGVPCVYSTEPVDARTDHPVVLPKGEATPFLERGRARASLGSLPTLTGIFGLTCAQVLIDALIGRRSFLAPPDMPPACVEGDTEQA